LVEAKADTVARGAGGRTPAQLTFNPAIHDLFL